MWDNHLWQLSFLKECQKYFKFIPANFQKALLLKSFEQARFWFNGDGKNQLCKNQIKIFKNALDEEYINYLLDYTKPSPLQVFARFVRNKINKF